MKYDSIDVDLALRYLGGNKELYYKFINLFLSNYHDFVFKLDEYRKIDILEFRRNVHSLKGITTNLGAAFLYEECVILEKRVDEDCLDDEAYKRFVNAFNKAYNDLKRIVITINL